MVLILLYHKDTLCSAIDCFKDLKNVACGAFTSTFRAHLEPFALIVLPTIGRKSVRVGWCMCVANIAAPVMPWVDFLSRLLHTAHISFHVVHYGGKSKHNATNDLIQVLWGFIWKCTAEKSQINATSVIMHATIKVLWIHIWTCTVEKIQTRETVVNIHATIQEFWGKLMCIKDNLAQLILTLI